MCADDCCFGARDYIFKLALRGERRTTRALQGKSRRIGNAPADMHTHYHLFVILSKAFGGLVLEILQGIGKGGCWLEEPRFCDLASKEAHFPSQSEDFSSVAAQSLAFVL